MRFIYICFFLFVACSLKDPIAKPQDDFDKIMLIMKTKSTADLIRHYGKPDEISVSEQDKNVQIFRYNDARIDAYVDKSNKDEISHLTVFFFEDFDNYGYLKNRFKKYKWIEKKILDPVGDVATDLYLVTIPEVRMQFEYDNYAPKRKVMWIYFD